MIPMAAGARAFTVAAALAVGHLWSAAPGTPVAAPALADRPRRAIAAARDSLSRDAELAEAGRRFSAAVRHCYSENGLKEDPTLSGLLRVRLLVLPAGDVREATVTATRVQGLGMPAVTACVATGARAWRFRDGAPRTERVVLVFDLLPPSS
jgi:hypothetical protein